MCAYPFPLLILLTPFALLSVKTAALAWAALLAGSVLIGICLTPRPLVTAGGCILYYPLTHALLLGNSSVLWFALSLLAISCGSTWSGRTRGLSAALLVLKPQAGLLIAGYLLCAAGDRRTAWSWFIGAVGVLVCSSFAIDPRWFSDWLSVLHEYRSSAVLVTLGAERVGLGLLAILQPFGFASAGMQFVAFSPNDIYCALPLLLLWLRFRTSLVVAGGGATWIGALWQINPNNAAYLSTWICMPLIAVLAGEALSRLPRYRHLQGLFRANWS